MENRIIYILMIFIVLTSCNGNNKSVDKINPIILKGQLDNGKFKELYINGIGNDFLHTITIDSSFAFTDTIPITKAGFYNLSFGYNQLKIYLEEGVSMSFNVVLDSINETMKFEGDLAQENNYLAKKRLLKSGFKSYFDMVSLDESSFLKEVAFQKEQVAIHFKRILFNNKAFESLEEKENLYAYLSLLENYPHNHKVISGNDNFKVSENYFNPMEKISYSDTTIFSSSPTYQHLLNIHFTRLATEKSSENGTNYLLEYLKAADKELPNGDAKDKIMSDVLKIQFKPNEFMEEVYTIYKDSDPNPENLSKISKIYEQYKLISTGNESPNFSFPNYSGQTKMLDDFKGKYVFIDVWASWCLPCLNEMPALKAIENEFKNRNIVFIGISIDKKEDVDKWKKKVNQKQLYKANQLFEGNSGKSEFMQKYAVTFIPRYILLDNEGKIITPDAPRPSDLKLKILLKKLFKNDE